MTRGEEIIIQSYDYGKYLLDTGFSTEEAALKCMRVAFIDGARWADSHPHWISVEDELPEVCVAVLTTTPHGTQRVGFYEDGWWLANSPDLVRLGSITHWMPLPSVEHLKEKE